MKPFKTYIQLVLLLITVNLTAQQRVNKLKQTIETNSDVEIDITTSHTNIEVETWNKNYIEVEAFVESKSLTKEELTETINNWDINVIGGTDRVKLIAKGGKGIWSESMSSSILDEESLEALANIDMELNLKPLLNSLEGLKDMEAFKELPEYIKKLRIPESPDGNYNINFDFDKYKKEGEPYLDRWSKKYKNEYGEEYEAEMRTWAKSFKQEDLDKFEKEMEAWGLKFGKEFEESFGKDFEKRMEKWGENFETNFEQNIAPKIEAWAENLGEELGKSLEEAFGEDNAEIKNKSKNKNKTKVKGVFDDSYNVIKTIKLKIPKKAKVNLNVNHGEFKTASTLHNVKANVTHGSLIAAHINGNKSAINVSYANVNIEHWDAGELTLNYVDNAIIETANQLMLSAVSSNIAIDTLQGNTIIDGSFGDLIINNIEDSFNTINIVLENSEARLKLPKSDYSLFFKGNKSMFNKETVSSKTIKNSSNSNKTIVINAKYSNIITQ